MTDERLAPFHLNRRRSPRKQRQNESSSKDNRQLVKRNPPSSSGGTDLRISSPNTFTRNGIRPSPGLISIPSGIRCRLVSIVVMLPLDYTAMIKFFEEIRSSLPTQNNGGFPSIIMFFTRAEGGCFEDFGNLSVPVKSNDSRSTHEYQQN
ncbi:unnamed protein product [Protopolystoma xenopodis]|uniref:Uncharacterized protein n=1 Tax=Protopolystoma xenopodis TaxID=117903 RepID=A0A3S5B8H3_9PLAT|nr:unnamed protein product [Protopolystoma xenopodis]